jgi:hypothetical protein
MHKNMIEQQPIMILFTESPFRLLSFSIQKLIRLSTI